VIEAIDKVKKEDWKNAFCIVRPPGHHSGESKVCTGFCFYNNVAIGARYLQKHHGVKKVLIFDWDVHHGDGTQHIFEEDPSVLFVSLHRHDDGAFVIYSFHIDLLIIFGISQDHFTLKVDQSLIAVKAQEQALV